MASVIEAVERGDADAIRAWAAAGGAFDEMAEGSGESPLAIAARLGNFEVVETLLELGADPNSLATTSWPLGEAIARRDRAMVELLLQHDADVNVVDEDDCSLLMDAAATGDLEIVNLLIEAGADARSRDNCGRRAIQCAAENGHAEVVAALAPLSTAQDRQRAELTLRLPKEDEIDPAVQAFFDAAERGDIKAVKEYLDGGGRVDALSTTGSTALHYAARRNQVVICRILVERGADVNAIDSYGDYPLVDADKTGPGSAYEFLRPLTSPKLVADFKRRMERAKKMAADRGYPYTGPDYWND